MPRPRVELTGTAGFSTFVDENFIEHVTAGAGLRVPFARRWSIEPRFTYMNGGAYDQDFFLTGSLVYDLETRRSVTPYLTIGGGIFWHRTAFGTFREVPFVSSDPHFSGGAGVRIRSGKRWSFVGEARFGFEPFFQAHVGIGYGF